MQINMKKERPKVIYPQDPLASQRLDDGYVLEPYWKQLTPDVRGIFAARWVKKN